MLRRILTIHTQQYTPEEFDEIEARIRAFRSEYIRDPVARDVAVADDMYAHAWDVERWSDPTLTAGMCVLVGDEIYRILTAGPRRTTAIREYPAHVDNKATVLRASRCITSIPCGRSRDVAHVVEAWKWSMSSALGEWSMRQPGDYIVLHHCVQAILRSKA